MNALLRRFRWNHDGIAATEFALIAPILILLLMASVEFPRALG
ncbi:TadE/TadG family type IV pilus assembly protein, partial [Methylorubrum extorquens]